MTLPPDPEELTSLGAPVVAGLPDGSAPGPVHLSVADLGRSRDWYRSTFLLDVRQDGARATLSAGGRDLVVLTEDKGARPSRGHSGLYHFALLVPGRADLARWLAHAVRERIPLGGMADHFVSEAVYLSDPDDHGIEVYWDRHRSLWEGQVSRLMGTSPLDAEDLLSELGDPATERFDGLPAGTTMGHVHLRVADLASTVAFYRDVLGLGLMAVSGRHAAFLSAGGYHHHLGVNTWESDGKGLPPPGTATLQRWTLVVASQEGRALLAARILAAGQDPEPCEEGFLVRDPSGIAVAIAPR